MNHPRAITSIVAASRFVHVAYGLTSVDELDGHGAICDCGVNDQGWRGR
jgi:hypothetical protein